jgi:8-oxo-dGTP pyrophosphatase MutT (NUDIX family)
VSQRPPPTEPRLAATILLLRDDPLEVLMVKRRSGSAFSSALVFPGGVVDDEDADEAWLPLVRGGHDLPVAERALRIAACREAFEETAVLVGVHAQPSGHSKTDSFLDFVRRVGVQLPLANIVQFGHWITPLRAPKRFDTHFYLCEAPDGVEPCTDGDETVKVEWVRPADALERAAAGDQALLFPTVMNLKRLHESSDVASALAAARARQVVTVTPSVEKRPHGLVVCIPEEAGYGVTEYAAPELMGKSG